MPLCSYIVTTAEGDRRCRREGHHEVAGLNLCWQHERDIRSHYEWELGVHDMAAKVHRLAARVERRLNLKGRRREDGPAVQVLASDGELVIVEGTDMCTIYFAEMENMTPGHHYYGLIKIGRTIDLGRRMEGLGTRAIKTLRASPQFETELHHRFAHLRVTGEWHRPGADLLDYMATL